MRERETRRLAVVGGGIGGLAAAALLSRRGFDVTVLEQAAGFGEVGAGLQIGPNGVKVLRQLGLADALDGVGVRPRQLVLRDGRTGWVVSRTGIAGDFERAYGAPYYHLHRADLLRLLQESIGAQVTLRTDARVTALDIDAPRPSLTIAAPPGARVVGGGPDAPAVETFEADAVIGADGIHSVVRDTLLGARPPRFTGNVAFRALIEVDESLRRQVPMDSTIWIGPGGHVVHYYVRGGTLLNIVAIIETDRWTDESWTQPAQPGELLAAFRGWNRHLLGLLERVGACHRWALHDRDPLSQWGRQATTLLGDAAHPMLPFLAQGAVMALEDAWVLADALAHESDTAAALRGYETRRMKRTARIQVAARARGEAMHRSGWVETWRRNATLFLRSRLARDDQLEKGQGLYGMDVTRPAPREPDARTADPHRKPGATHA